MRETMEQIKNATGNPNRDPERTLERQRDPVFRTAIQQGFPDDTLLNGVRRRERSAMADLYDRYAPLVYAVALRVLKKPQGAEDVMQEVLLQLWREPEMFDESRGSLGAWLSVMARNRSIDQLRRTRRLTEIGDLDFEAPVDVENEAVRNEAIAKIRNVLAGMPAEQRAALEMAVFEGCTHTEIAARTNTPLGTVKTRIRSGLHMIKATFA